jgi:hypothetical protein
MHASHKRCIAIFGFVRFSRAPFAQVISWNVTTLRSLVNKNPQMLANLFSKHSPDIVFFQVLKTRAILPMAMRRRHALFDACCVAVGDEAKRE